MRNLKNVRHLHVRLDDDAPLTATAWNPVDQSIICAFGPTEHSPAITLKRIDSRVVGDATIIAHWDALCPDPDSPCDQILSLHYIVETSSICLVLAGGDLVLVKDDPQTTENPVEIVGSVDEGIAAAAWAPDDDLLTVCTRANTLLFMTRAFDPLSTVTLSPDDVNVSAHVSVGWGKKETQFKGKRAKSLHDPTVKDADEGLLSQYDDGVTTLSWRGDGAYVVLNTVQDGNTRMLRVFTREGELDSVSEPVNGLESALSWRPAGNLISCVQRFHDHVDVVFFERNGLRHGQFTLRLSEHDLALDQKGIHLAWNADSSILAVSFSDRVQLWTMGNYHYYLKQEIPLQSASRPTPQTTIWHTEFPMQVVVSDTTALQSLNYTFDVSNGPAISPLDAGLAVVIDGRLLKLTPLRIANVPPPMSLLQIELSENVIDVAIDPRTTKIAVLCQQSVYIYSVDCTRMPCSLPQLLQTVVLGDLIQRPRQILFDSSTETGLVILSDHSTLLYCVGTENITDVYVHDTPVMTLCRNTHGRPIAFEDACAKIYQLETSKHTISTNLLGSLATPCPWVETWTRLEDELSETLIFSLSSGGTLNVTGASMGSELRNISQIANVTSFLLTSAHLIFTTTQHLLKFVHLQSSGLKPLDIPMDEPEKDERCRAIERGAKLIAVMPSDYKLVLQMPRGNLETIYPRALVLASIRDNLKALQYRKAFLTCRTHRVDMNILHDFAPTMFMENVHSFVTQLESVTYIDLFLSSLKEEDVADTMYKDTLGMLKLDSSTEIASEPSTKSKVNGICDALLEVLDKQKDKHLQNLVTAQVCKSPPDLEAGLALIAQLRREQPDLVERAVEHICFLADVNKLYDIALGLYDLDVALLVAQQSQKDPREYLPHLQRLNELTANGQREFTIDNELRRYTKALTHLSSLDDFAQVKTYTAKNELYTHAMHIYRYQASRLNELTRMYADFLSSRNRFADAGQALECLGDYAAATTAYRAATLWREALSCAALAGLPVPAQREIAQSLADGLLQSKDYKDAATIFAEHLHDIEAAIRALGTGYFFSDAIRTLALHNRSDLLTSTLDPSLSEAFSNTTETLSEMRSQLFAQIPRIRELRVKKRTDALAFFGGGPGATAPDGADIPDDVSLASTTLTTRTSTTLATRYTNATDNTLSTSATRRTSKNRRREERKRARGKKGSVYEEEYLVNSVRRLIERLETVGGDEAERLVDGLLRRGMREQAAAIQKVVLELWAAVEGSLIEVFGPQVGAQGHAHGQTPGQASGIGDDEEGGDEVQAQVQALPRVRPFRRFCLLGD